VTYWLSYVLIMLRFKRCWYSWTSAGSGPFSWIWHAVTCKLWQNGR